MACATAFRIGGIAARAARSMPSKPRPAAGEDRGPGRRAACPGSHGLQLERIEGQGGAQRAQDTKAAAGEHREPGPRKANFAF
jgi:hypothetical protein